MMIVSTWLAFCAGVPASVTLTVTVALPAVVGTPLTTHALSDRPAGSVPVIEQEYGDVPPLAVIVELYATPTVPLGSVLVSESGVGAMVIVSLALTLCVGELVSVTFTVTVEVSAVVGVPVTAQPDKASPAGRVPLVMEQAYGVVPPVAEIVAE
jgi:hypothetical protein